MSEEIRISTPYDFYMEYYDPEFHTKDNFKFPSKLVFNALRCSIIDIISFFNTANDKYRIKTNMNTEFENERNSTYLKYKQINQDIEYIPFFTEKMLFSGEVTIAYSEWEKWTNAYCKEDEDYKGYYVVKYELLNIKNDTIDNSLLYENEVLKRKLEEAQNNYGLCSKVIKLRMEGKSQAAVAKILKKEHPDFSNPVLGVLIYDEVDGEKATSEAIRKCASRALGNHRGEE